MIRSVNTRQGKALIALGIVVVLAAALLPGASFEAFYVPAFTFVLLTFSWHVRVPQNPPLPALVYVRAPLDPRGPPPRFLA